MNNKLDPFAKLGQKDKEDKSPTSSSLDQRLFASTKKNVESPVRSDGRTDEHVSKQTDKQKSFELTPPKEKSERKLKRNPFDVFEDQLIALSDIQHQSYKATGKKPTLGELVREALDDLIKKKST